MAHEARINKPYPKGPMNYCYVDQDGSVDLKLGPLYFSSFSQVEHDEELDHGDLGFSQGFCDVYLDLYGLGIIHLGLGTALGGGNVLERLGGSFIQ